MSKFFKKNRTVRVDKINDDASTKGFNLKPFLKAKFLIPSLLVLALILAAFMVYLFHGSKAVTTTGYPRIGLWRPNFSTQTMSDISRYNYVVMPSAADQGNTTIDNTRISQLKALNPNIILLDDVNSSELPYDVNGTFGAAFDAVRLGAVDPSWILTQVGSKTSGAVDGVTTTIPVASVTNFRVGDLVVLEREYVLVTAVNTNSLTVKRAWAGSKTATHASGVRLAAAVSGWPGSIKLDITDNCPLADVGHGPERFRDWVIRTQATRLSLHPWDGMFIDLCAGEMTYGRGTTSWRTIASRTNPDVETDYAAFDASWATGITTYLNGLRAAVGTAPILMPNDATAAYSSVNGAIHESFPKPTDPTYWWRQWMFGPVPSQFHSSTAYLDWVVKGLQPNLSTILTYQTSSGLGPHSSTFVPDYQKMRYGLTSALMGNGYFSFEIASDRQLWFDEYDNAGAGRGYLGQPLGAAQLAIPALTTPDLLAGSGAMDTTTQLSTWHTSVTTGYTATTSLDTTVGSAKIAVTSSAGSDKVKFYHTGVNVVAGTPYTLTFKAKGSAANDRLWANLQNGQTPWANLCNTEYAYLTPDWKTYTFSFIPSGSDTNAQLIFNFGEKVNNVWIDDVTIQSGWRADVWRRNYDNGIALVNSTDKTLTIPLGGTYRKIKGTQAPTVNDGSTVTAVTIPPKDGIILLNNMVPVTDTTPPTVSLTSPVNNSTVSGTVTIAATASDNVGVTKVEFYDDTTLLATVLSSPYTYSWNTASVASGSHVIKAKAYDAAGNFSESSVIVTVSSSTSTGNPVPPPVVFNITQSPSNGTSGVAWNVTVTLTFNRDLDPTTVNNSNFGLYKYSDGSTVSSTVAYNSTNKTVSIKPISNLGSNTQYYIGMTANVADTAGNHPTAWTWANKSSHYFKTAKKWIFF